MNQALRYISVFRADLQGALMSYVIATVSIIFAEKGEKL